MVIVNQLAFQEQIPDNYCWGCGRANAGGLRIRSYWLEDEAVCTWKAEEYYASGPRHVLNGGIIATIIDCHCVCTAIAAAYRAERRAFGTEPRIWYATASLKLTYLRPTPISVPVVLRARIEDTNERKTMVRCSLFSGDERCVQAELLAVRVPPAWLEAK